MTEAPGSLNCRPPSTQPRPCSCPNAIAGAFTPVRYSKVPQRYRNLSYQGGYIVMIIWLYKAMLRIARLFSHNSFGVKKSLKRQKTLLIKRVNGGLPAPCRFRPRFDIKLSRSWRVQVRNYRPDKQGANTKTTNCPRSLAPRFSLISDSKSKIKKYA